MGTTPLKPDNKGDKNPKKWTRESIAAAVAAGAITTEAANLLYAQLSAEKEEEAITGELTQEAMQPDNNSEQITETNEEPAPLPHQAHSQSHFQPNHHNHQESEPLPTPEPDPIPEPEPTPEPEPEPTPGPEPEPDPWPDPWPEPEPEPIPEPEPDPNPIDLVDVIVTRIDEKDIDMEDLILVDSIGTVHTVDGQELTAAMIHDSEGIQAMMIDVDGDNVFDEIIVEDGTYITQVPGDIDISDLQLLFTQQHNYSGYIEPNDYDIALNQTSSEMDNNVSLS